MFLHSRYFPALVFALVLAANSRFAMAQTVPTPLPTDPAFISRITTLAAGSRVTSVSWRPMTGRDRAEKERSAPGKRVAPIGYTKGMALLYAEAYARLKQGDAITVELSKAASSKIGLDGLQYLRSGLLKAGMSVDKDGVETLRSLYVLLYELGIRESDGRTYLGLDTGENKPYEPINSSTTEAGLFQSSWNFAYNKPLAHRVFEKYRKSPSHALPSLSAIFSQGMPLPKNRNDGNVGSGTGLEFQKLTKSNPGFAVEFAAAVIRTDAYSNYYFIRYKLMQIERAAAALFRDVEKAVDQSITKKT
jgi:hypothetical protein